MPNPILHHYPMSPFAEKVRLILGFKDLMWRSVIVPIALPKPDVLALTGGYRRTPVLQIGADIYCDTALISRVIDRLKPDPPLYPDATSGIADIVAQWADTTLWWTAIPFTMQPAGVAHVMKDFDPDVLKSFAVDRAAMTANIKRATVADGTVALRNYLARLEHLLDDGRPFLLGPLPCIADFSAAQSIWFIRLAPPVASVLESYPKMWRWYQQMHEFGHGSSAPMTSEEAIGASVRAAAGNRYAAFGFVPEPGLDEGDDVTVMPMDYAHDPAAGRLIGLSAQEVVIARVDDRAGKVHVHFPRIAYQIKKQKPA
jgi:glutathione S-transferase